MHTIYGGDKMLIRYSFKNFRSFHDKAEISMKATSQTTLNENIIRINGERLLPSTVIYGANASGKSNIIMSIKIFKKIIICGSLLYKDIDLDDLELCPFIHDGETNPISFEIEFINKNKHCIYKLEIEVEKCRRGNRTILNEEFYIKSCKKYHLIYKRNKSHIDISTDRFALKQMETEAKFINDITEKLSRNMDASVPFLTSGFKNIISNDLANCVISFFSEKLITIDNFTITTSSVQLKSNQTIEKNFTVWNQTLDGFVKGADFGPQQMIFKSDVDDNDEHTANMQLFSVYNFNDQNIFIPAQLMESSGTLKLIDFALLFQSFFPKGCTFFMDEFDASLHPEIVKGIISLFHDSDFNTEGSQLIFTTHNPIYLNNKIFRRDQIAFVEKDRINFQSSVYTLADFGSTDVRNDENYLINYFKGKYSSLPYIDFSSLFKGDD